MDLVVRLLTARLLAQSRRGEGAFAARARVDVVLAGALSNSGQPFASLEVRVADRTDRAVNVDLVRLEHFVVDLRTSRKRNGCLIIGIGKNIVVEDGTKPRCISTGIEIDIIHALQFAATDRNLVGAGQLVLRLTRSRTDDTALGVRDGLEVRCRIVGCRKSDILIGFGRRQGRILRIDAVVIGNGILARSHRHRDDAGALEMIEVIHLARGYCLGCDGAFLPRALQRRLIQVDFGRVAQVIRHGVGID